MSKEILSTEDDAIANIAHCHGNDEQLSPSSSTTLARQITEVNKERSPLMRLPAEIRAIILRELVGDKLIHVNTGRGIVREDGQYWTLIRGYSDIPRSIEDYASLCSPRGNPWWTQFEILNASYQLHREAFPLFWRTCEFYFDREAAFSEFVNRIDEAQKANLRRLAIINVVSCESDPDFRDGRGPWATYFHRTDIESLLDSVCSLVLHLGIYSYGWIDSTSESRKNTLINAFGPFEPLRFLALKEAKVILSLPECDWRYFEGETAKQKPCLEAKMSKRLLDPTLTKADVVGALTERIHRLERLKNKAESIAQRKLRQAEESQRLAIECSEAARQARTRADAKRGAIEGLQVALQKDNLEEMAGLMKLEEIDK